MGKLDVNVMRHMSKDDFRVLTAVEMGMKNHHAVPVALVGSIAFGRVARKAATRNLTTLLRFKLVYHDNTKYDGYRLTWSGYDVLALRALCQRGVVASLGSKIGEGKESDVYEAFPGDDEESSLYAIKFHRLGKTSFKAVKTKRDYLEGRHMGNWLNMSRLAAKREWTVLSALHGVQKNPNAAAHRPQPPRRRHVPRVGAHHVSAQRLFTTRPRGRPRRMPRRRADPREEGTRPLRLQRIQPHRRRRRASHRHRLPPGRLHGPPQRRRVLPPRRQRRPQVLPHQNQQ
mmetsp:Transcript_14352/g.46840  ORF Transcript_14352/g.46840 Transcript_14352/m.46840 type:complete len:287 (-) Transcript_14352:264-1124(-)